MNDEKLKKILTLVNEYISEKQAYEEVHDKGFVRYAGPYFNSDEYVSAVETLLDGWLVMGNKSQEFERKFPSYLGRNRGVLTNSGSSANLLMMSSLKSKQGYNLPDGTKVLVPVAGFPTTLNPIIQKNFTPIFVDIELETLNLDLDDVERTLEEHPDIRVITFAHVLGNPPNMNRVMELVNKYDLIFLEDCCDALGSSYGGQLLGSFGDMASCSFYPAHHITMGEGGFVVCGDRETENILRSFREWGRACFIKGTPINVNESIKNIEDIKIGDLVVSHTGKLRKVEELFVNDFKGDYYTFKTRLKNKISSTDYHPHLILKSGSDEPQWILSKDIEVGDYFVEKIPEEKRNSYSFSWKYNTLYKTVNNFFEAEPDLMRLIGYWLAEGCVIKSLKGKGNCYKENKYYCYRVEFSFHKDENEYIDDVKYLMRKYFGISGYYGRSKFRHNGRTICFKSRKGYEFFNQFFGKYSYGKSLPENMVNWNNELTSELVKGYWCGDGNYSATNNSFSIDGVSYTLIEQVRRILLKYGIISSYCIMNKESRQIVGKYNIYAKHDLHSIRFYGTNAELFSKEILNDPIKSRSNRQFSKIKNGYVLYRVYDISKEYIEDKVYNIEVEKDHSYHAFGIATHNCYCIGPKANALKCGTCKKRFSNWITAFPDEIFDHKYIYDEVGYNLKPIDLQSAIGLEQLNKLPEITKKRKDNFNDLMFIFKVYEEFFILPKATQYSDPNWFAFPLTLKENVPFTRNQLVDHLESNGIQTRPYFAGNILLQPAYSGMYGTDEEVMKRFPNATYSMLNTFFLGVSPVVTQHQISKIMLVVDGFMKDYI